MIFGEIPAPWYCWLRLYLKDSQLGRFPQIGRCPQLDRNDTSFQQMGWLSRQQSQRDDVTFPEWRPVWSESSLSAWRSIESLAIHWAHSEDSYQPKTCCSVFLRTCISIKSCIVVAYARNMSVTASVQSNNNQSLQWKIKQVSPCVSNINNMVADIVHLIVSDLNFLCMVAQPIEENKCMFSSLTNTHLSMFAIEYLNKTYPSKVTYLQEFNRQIAYFIKV